MSLLLDQYERRVGEIELYFRFLHLVVVRRSSLSYGTRRGKTEKIDEDLIKILKANAFLLLYNLVESSIRDGLRRIYEAIATDGITYDRLRKELREVWVHNMVVPDPSRTVEKSTQRVMELIEKIVADELITFDIKFISITGSLDAAKVRALAERHGFSHKTTKVTQGGAVLVDVKRERNNLAHGHKSFVECGRDLTFPNLLTINVRAVTYMRQILANIDHYIDNKHYRAAS